MRGELIRLRPVRQGDSDLLYSWINDRDLVHFNAPFKPVPEPEHLAWLDSILARRADLVFFVIEETTSDLPIGTCQLFNINWIHRHAELQIRIGNRAFHGAGYGTEAIRLLVDHGFNDLNLHRIFLHVFASNVRAINAYKKAGFVTEGCLRDGAYIDGAFVDVIVMGALKG